MIKSKAIVVGLFCLGVAMSFDLGAKEGEIFRYIITESGPPTSLDPLDADAGNNLPVTRMIYATPMEVSAENQLSSHVLESFRYEPSTRTIHWTVKKGLHFDDGTELSAQDVVFAVARMAYTRPSFPILEKIEGIREWVKAKTPLKSLPIGIKVDGQKISNRLSGDVDHPLFRFCLELFSVIPKRCVDVDTNTISCASVPASGHYRIVDKTNSSYQFALREGSTIDGVKAPQRMRFDYVLPEGLLDLIPSMNATTVMAGNEISFSSDDMAMITKKLRIKFTPASRFSTLLLNPDYGPFKDRNCRRLFAKKFRDSYVELFGNSKPMESSIFTKILPGYISSVDLEKSSPLSDKEVAQCMSTFAKSKIPWGYATSEKRSMFIETLEKTMAKMGTGLTKPIIVSNRKEVTDLFAVGKIWVSSASSGFWALDPAGDMKMLLTPNLHKVLKFVSADPTVQQLISDLGEKPDGFAKVNRRIYEQANLNVYTHVRRFFAASSQHTLADVPFAITSPAPWQVFKVK